MKKSNAVILALLAACSAFLLWLWYFLGFNRVDDPVDLVLSVVWWAAIVVAIVAIVKAEQARRRRVRTVYVGEGATFNSEKGLAVLKGEDSMKDVLAAILEDLKYDFTREDFPEKDEFQPKYFVRTKEFAVEEPNDDSAAPEGVAGAVSESAGATPNEAAPAQIRTQVQARSQQKTWKGEVFIVASKEEKPFDTPEELASILASLEAAA